MKKNLYYAMEDKRLKNVDEYKVEIMTGQYTTAPLEQKLMIQNILGEDAEYNFEIYFHWYNMIPHIPHPKAGRKYFIQQPKNQKENSVRI